MMRSLVVFAVFACILVHAQEETPQSEQPPADAGATPVIAQVQMEEFVSRKYLEIILKLQHTQAQMIAGSLWSKAGALENEENGIISTLETESHTERDLEENIFFDTDSDNEYGDRFAELNDDEAKLDLLASYQLFRAVNIKNLQAIFHAGELQREYFLDRTLQYALGGGADQALQTLLFVKTYSTMLKTMRLSYTFQYLSHFRTWLEDSLDFNVAVVSGSEHKNELYADAADDLARDRMWAFHAYRNYAMLDYQIFFVDSYLEYYLAGATGSLGGGSLGGGSFGQQPPPQEEPAAEGQTNHASFLEEEVEAQPSQSQFIPFMAYNYNPAMYLKLYRFFFLTYQLQGATSAFMSSYVETKAIDEDSESIKTKAQELFLQFAHSLTATAQLEYMTTMFEVYSLFAPAVAGSFAGGSLGQGSV